MSTTTTTTISADSRGRAQRKRRILAADGTSLAVTDWAGPNTTRTVVFLHGLCLSHGAWEAQIAHTLRRFGSDTRVITYDHRGHGESAAAPAHTYRVEQLAADLDAVLVALNVRGPVTLVGHSMGAMTAMTYAATPRWSRSVDVAALVLVATAAGGLCAQGVGRVMDRLAVDPVTSALMRVPAKATGAITAPVRLLLDRVRVFESTRAGALAAVFSDALAVAELSTAVGFLTDLRRFDQTPNLHRITARTTILSGGNDLLTPPELSWEMEAAIDGAAHIHLPGAGHMIPQQHPRVVNAAITAAVEAAGSVAAVAQSPSAMPLRRRGALARRRLAG